MIESLYETIINSLNVPQLGTCNNCYLQVIPVTLTNGSFKDKTNALLDSGSDSTLVSQDTADKLRLKGENRQLQISNVFNTQINHLSKLIKFNISLDMHPNPIKISYYYIIYMIGTS